MAASKTRKTEREWNFLDTENLIKEYEKYPCLYNTSVREYKDRDKRKQALQSIAAVFETTADEISKKFSRLRIQFNRECTKLTIGAKSGSSSEDTLKSKVTWGHFKSLQFLKNFYQPKSNGSYLSLFQSTESQAEREDMAQSQSDDEDGASDLSVVFPKVNKNDEDGYTDVEFSHPKTSIKNSLYSAKTKRIIKRQRMEEDGNLTLQRAVTLFKKATSTSMEAERLSSANADDIFGQYVANELKSIKDEYVKKIIKHKIQTLLFETQIPSLSSEYSVTSNGSVNS